MESMTRKLIFLTLSILILLGCNLTSPSVATPVDQPATATIARAITHTALPPTSTVPPSDTPLPTETASSTAAPTTRPTVESLPATVTADLLSCRYGPGAEYLYLYALRKTAKITLIGRTDANNWVWVEGKSKCWVNTKFLEIQGDPLALPIVYPNIVKLPVSPYYPGPKWANAKRKGEDVEVDWEPVPISPGKYEDENMHQYIVEVWRCQDAQIVFETLGTNSPFITVKNDQAGCNAPSHGRVFVQEKHGYGGPVEIPWPAHP